MRNSNEISAELETRLAEFESCQDVAQRKDLAGKVEELTRELKDAQLSEAARKAQANQRVLTPQEKKDIRRFSISKFLRQSLPGETMDGIEAEMAAEGKREFQESIKGAAEGVFLPSALLRTYYYTNAQEANYGQAFIEQTSLTYIGKLRNATIGRRLGVRYLDGLQGQIAFVTGGADASWVEEEAAASKQKPTYAKKVMAPKRLQVLQGVTYDLMHQTSKALDDLILEDMVKAHAVALDAAIFAGSGSSGQPTGVLAASGVNDITIGTDGGPLTYNLLVQMETEVGIDNGLLDNTLAYVSNAKVQGKLKTIPQIAGYPYYLMNDGKVNGYPFYMSNAIPSNLTKGSSSGVCSAIIFGNWSEVLVGSWGGLQIIVDPYSAKDKGVLEISAAAYHDVLVRTPEAFCKIDEVTTA
jgi:HK97 family phage major capsid protein